MSRGTNQKLKIIYLMKILLEMTDDEHSLTLAEILQELARYDISAERKSIYADFESLRLYGIDIISEQRNRTVYYHVDKIHQAIGKNVKIKFQYYQWNVNKEMKQKPLRILGEV